jgi:hypothetical protein
VPKLIAQVVSCTFGKQTHARVMVFRLLYLAVVQVFG